MQPLSPIPLGFDVPETTEDCLAQARKLSNKLALEIAQVDGALTFGTPADQSVPRLCLGVRVPLELAHEDLTRITHLLQNLKHDISDGRPAGSLPVPHHRPSCEWCLALQSAFFNIDKCSTGLKRLSSSFSDPSALDEACGNVANIFRQLQLLSMMLDDLERRVRAESVEL